MIITNISRVFFHWYEYEAMVKFEKENPNYKKVAEDTTGTSYEYRLNQGIDVAERKEE